MKWRNKMKKLHKFLLKYDKMFVEISKNACWNFIKYLMKFDKIFVKMR